MNSHHDRNDRNKRAGRPSFKGHRSGIASGPREQKGDRPRGEHTSEWPRERRFDSGERSGGRLGEWKRERRSASGNRRGQQSDGYSRKRRFDKSDHRGQRSERNERPEWKKDQHATADTVAEVHPNDPALPEEVTADMLDGAMRRHLMTLSKENAETVARHLVMAGALLEEDPASAHEHAQAAQRHGGRVGIVREALAMTAYHTGDYAMAVREIHAFRRLTGTQAHQVIEADSQRGLGRPERALDVIAHVDKNGLRDDFRVELTLVESGARADLRQYDAGLLAIDTELQRDYPPHLLARLLAVRADRLSDLGRDSEAEQARTEAVSADPAVFGEIGPDGQELDDELLLVEDE